MYDGAHCRQRSVATLPASGSDDAAYGSAINVNPLITPQVFKQIDSVFHQA
jgi:hypothetical protein